MTSARRLLPQDHPQLGDAASTHWQTPATQQSNNNPGVHNTTLTWFDQTIDHFNWQAPFEGSNGTYKQRVFSYDKYYAPCDSSKPAPIFFYTGNEGPVELYVNSAGLMWENAAEFGALIVFAEHRYYGESMPLGPDSLANSTTLRFLSVEQALADYANLLVTLRNDLAAKHSCISSASDIDVISFGGSYGGMLSFYFRLHYPYLVTGAIAASAPVLFYEDMQPTLNTEPYWAVVTADASPAGGSAPACADNVRRSWDFMYESAKTEQGRAQLSQTFRLCAPLTSAADAVLLEIFLLNAWDTLAMGDYPYPDNYLTVGGPYLPAFPVREACQSMAAPNLTGWALLEAHNNATGVFNNATLNVKCYDLPTNIYDDGEWDFQVCTETLPEETFFSRGGADDMFYSFAYNITRTTEHCEAKYGISPRPSWMRKRTGNLRELQRAAPKNIVLSNGRLDPWSAGGITEKDIWPGAVAILIDESAHHLDLFFSNPEDPPSVTAARKLEVEQIRQWLTPSE